MSIKRKCESFTIEEKYHVIKLVEQQIAYSEIMKKFPKIKHPSNISKMIRMKDQIKKEFEEGFCPKKKSLKTTANKEFEEKLKSFVSKCTSNKITLSMPIIQNAAINYGEEINVTNVKSRGYFQKFCQRNNIELHKIHGEANSVPEEKTDNWFNELPNLIKD